MHGPPIRTAGKEDDVRAGPGGLTVLRCHRDIAVTGDDRDAESAYGAVGNCRPAGRRVRPILDELRAAWSPAAVLRHDKRDDDATGRRVDRDRGIGSRDRSSGLDVVTGESGPRPTAGPVSEIPDACVTTGGDVLIPVVVNHSRRLRVVAVPDQLWLGPRRRH